MKIPKSFVAVGRLLFFGAIAILSFQSIIDKAFAAPDSTVNSRVTDMENLDSLKSLFQKDTGKVRIVTLLSPT